MANTPSSLPDAMDQGEARRVAGGGDCDHGVAGGRRLGQVGRGVGHGRRDVGDRDGDRLGVGVVPSVARTTRS